MTLFYQFHMLTAYPPSNLNRDDLGRPKSAMVGLVPRLRISSQSLKRAWRTSPVFLERTTGELGIRTKDVAAYVQRECEKRGLTGELCTALAQDLDLLFRKGPKKLNDFTSSGKSGKGKKTRTETVDLDESDDENSEDSESRVMIFLGAQELIDISDLISFIASGQRPSTEQICNVLRKRPGGADLAMFGRMLASSPTFNVEAAVQVSHAFTVHKSTSEDDYFTAMDDLTKFHGAGHVDVAEFGSGLFYTYICVNWDLLVSNLSDNSTLAGKAVVGLIEAATTVSPTGKQNSFASRAYASYVRAERGQRQPRSLMTAFLRPVDKINVLADSVSRLEATCSNFDHIYGQCYEKCCVMNVETGEGSLSEVLALVS